MKRALRAWLLFGDDERSDEYSSLACFLHLGSQRFLSTRLASVPRHFPASHRSLLFTIVGEYMRPSILLLMAGLCLTWAATTSMAPSSTLAASLYQCELGCSQEFYPQCLEEWTKLMNFSASKETVAICQEQVVECMSNCR